MPDALTSTREIRSCTGQMGQHMTFTRYAVYYLPPDGPLSDFGATWLGWDVSRAEEVAQAPVPGLAEATAAPRKYGLHATLKPPFRLAAGTTPGQLEEAVARVARGCAAARCDRLELSHLGRFLALVPVGNTRDISRVAGTCVKDLDIFRSPPDDAELHRRRRARLSDRQEAMLRQWGYPHVLEEFRFHMTLTGSLPKADIPMWIKTVSTRLPELPAPFMLDEIALVGEREDGRFALIRRHALTGR